MVQQSILIMKIGDCTGDVPPFVGQQLVKKCEGKNACKPAEVTSLIMFGETSILQLPKAPGSKKMHRNCLFFELDKAYSCPR
jgi:hypothetical protein